MHTMSTKTIAVNVEVYGRLAAARRENESFSKAINRLLSQVASAHTSGDILQGLSMIASLSEADSRQFLDVIAENRGNEPWPQLDLR